MEDNRLKITANKLKRLNVLHELNHGNLILRGTSFSKGQFFFTVTVPIIVFFLFITGMVLYILAQENEVIVYPKIMLALLLLPLVLLYFGIKNFFRLKKSKKYQVHIRPGRIILKGRTIDEKTIPVEKVVNLFIKIEENKANSSGEIYVESRDNESYLLLSVLGNNLKYFKDDLEYIRKTFVMILQNFETKTENNENQERNQVQTDF